MVYYNEKYKTSLKITKDEISLIARVCFPDSEIISDNAIRFFIDLFLEEIANNINDGDEIYGTICYGNIMLSPTNIPRRLVWRERNPTRDNFIVASSELNAKRYLKEILDVWTLYHPIISY